MKRIAEKYPFFLFLLPLFVIIHLEKEIHPVINYKFLYERIIIFFIFPLLIFAFIFLLTKSQKKAALISFIFSLFFFYTGEIKAWLTNYFGDSIWQSYKFILLSILLVSSIIIYMIRKSRSDFRNHFLIINTGLALFIISDIVLISLNFNKSKFKILNDNVIATPACKDCVKPDIYYILLDAYTSGPVLQSEFEYPNIFIQDDLKNKGFKIFEEATSNYTFTAFSIASTLNINYIENVDTANKLFDRDYFQALKLVYKNRLFTFLEKEGYNIFNHSVFDIKSHPSTLNNIDNWGCREIFDHYNIFIKLYQDLRSYLPGWIENLFNENIYFMGNPYTRFKLDSLVQQNLIESAKSNSDNPKFVYAHFMKTHPPFLMDSLGNIFSNSPIGMKESYIHQIAYCNRLIKIATDSILANAKKPLVIIIQGDHGYQKFITPDKQKQFAVFHAAYFSNQDYHLYSDSVSNVNTFRIVLNTFFNKNYPLLKNQKFFQY